MIAMNSLGSYPERTACRIHFSRDIILGLALVGIICLLMIYPVSCTTISSSYRIDYAQNTNVSSSIYVNPAFANINYSNVQPATTIPLQVQMSAYPSTIQVGGDIALQSAITVTVKDTDGEPVENVALTIDMGGSLGTESGSTDSTGVFTTYFYTSTPGTYTLRLTSITPPSGYTAPSAAYATTTVTVVKINPVSTQIIAPSTATVSIPVDIVVKATDSDGNPVPNVQLTLNAGGASISPSSGTTNSEGEFPATFSSSSKGTYTLKVSDISVPAGYTLAMYGSMASITITVQEAPSQGTISTQLLANPSSVIVSLSTNLLARVVDTEGKPIPNTYVILDGGGGTITPLNGYTDSNGEFPAKFSSIQKGIYTVKIADITLPSGYSKPPAPYASVSISVTSSGSDAPSNSNPQYQAPAEQSSGQTTNSRSGLVPVENYPPKAYFSVFPAAGQVPLNVSADGSGSTDSDGYIKSWEWNFGDGTTGKGKIVSHTYQDTGTYTITLLVKDNLGASSSSAQQVTGTAKPAAPVVNEPVPPAQTTVPQQTTDWTAVIVGAAVALIAAAAIYLAWIHESMSLNPQKKSVPCDGSSTIPIQIQFNNPFGKIRRQRRDREIELKTTSGTIQNVILPAGKEMVEAILTASTEGGPVTVTATSDKKIAEVQVKFECIEKEIDIEISPMELPADGVSKATVYIKIKNDKGRYITSLTERTVELKSTLGTITSPAIIPPKSLSGTATLTAGTVVGTARISASMNVLSGEKEIVFSDLAKRYCMHCGTTMSMDASKCPKCGNTPPSGVDTKQCSTCGAVLPIIAKYCDMCGARQPIDKKDS